VTYLALFSCQTAEYQDIITWAVLINMCITVIIEVLLLLWMSLMCHCCGTSRLFRNVDS